jgi:radical SAM superfamily enzyme YgiQ (UPF0313 family)
LARIGVPVFGCGDSMIDLKEPHCDELLETYFAGIDLHEHFFILTRLNHLHKEGCRSLKESGVNAVWIGIEAASSNVLTAMRKGISPSQIESQLQIAKNAGLNVGGFFMLGFPGETHETARLTLDLIESLFNKGLMDYVDTSIFVPYPGLDIYHQPRSYGLIPYDKTWNDWDFWGRPGEKPVFDLVNLSREDIYMYWKEAGELKKALDIREKSENRESE